MVTDWISPATMSSITVHSGFSGEAGKKVGGGEGSD